MDLIDAEVDFVIAELIVAVALDYVLRADESVEVADEVVCSPVDEIVVGGWHAKNGDCGNGTGGAAMISALTLQARKAPKKAVTIGRFYL